MVWDLERFFSIMSFCSNLCHMEALHLSYHKVLIIAFVSHFWSNGRRWFMYYYIKQSWLISFIVDYEMEYVCSHIYIIINVLHICSTICLSKTYLYSCMYKWFSILVQVVHTRIQFIYKLLKFIAHTYL